MLLPFRVVVRARSRAPLTQISELVDVEAMGALSCGWQLMNVGALHGRFRPASTNVVIYNSRNPKSNREQINWRNVVSVV